MVEILGILDIGKMDKVGKRIRESIEVSGANPYYWEEVTAEEAWREVVSGFSEWRPYAQDRSELPGGIMERELRNIQTGGLVGVAFIGLKNLDKPKGWKKGFVGMKSAVLTLGIITKL